MNFDIKVIFRSGQTLHSVLTRMKELGKVVQRCDLDPSLMWQSLHQRDCIEAGDLMKEHEDARKKRSQLLTWRADGERSPAYPDNSY